MQENRHEPHSRIRAVRGVPGAIKRPSHKPDAKGDEQPARETFHGRNISCLSRGVHALSLLCALCVLCANLSAQTAQITLVWSYPTNVASDTTLGFVFLTTTNLATPLTNWVTLTNVPATNCLSTNLDATGTNFIGSLPIQVAPGASFYVMESSNFWGLSQTSNTASTPPPAAAAQLKKITHP